MDVSAVAAPAPPEQAALRRWHFPVFLVTSTFSTVGTWVQQVVGYIVILELTDSAFMVGLLGFANFLPIFLLSLPAGAITDRLPRSHVIVATHGLSLAVAVSLTVLAHADALSAPVLLLHFFALGASYAFAKPAMQAALPALVEPPRLAHAISLNSMQFSFSVVVGPIVAASLLETIGVTQAFLINALTYVGPIVAALAIPTLARRPTSEPVPLRAAIGAGVRGVVNDPVIRSVLAGISVSGFAIEMLRTAAPILAVLVLDGGETALGTLLAANGTGSIVMMLFIHRLLRHLAPRSVVLLGFAGFAACGVVIAVSSAMPVTTAAFALAGAFHVLCFTTMTIEIQRNVDDSLRGRAMSIHSLCFLGSRPFASLLTGTLAAVLTVQTAVAAVVLVCILGVVVVAKGALARDRPASLA